MNEKKRKSRFDLFPKAGAASQDVGIVISETLSKSQKADGKSFNFQRPKQTKSRRGMCLQKLKAEWVSKD